MWCSAWRALEGEDSEGQDKGLVRCRKMWQGTQCSHWSTTVSEQGSAGTGLCIYALPSFCSKPHHPTSQRSGMDVTKGGRLTEHPSHRALGQPVLPLEPPPLTAPSCVQDSSTFLCTLLVLLIFPACSMSQWNLETEIWLGMLCPSPYNRKSPSLRSPAHKVHACSPCDWNTQVWAGKMIRGKTRLCWQREKSKYGDCKQLHSSFNPPVFLPTWGIPWVHTEPWQCPEPPRAAAVLRHRGALTHRMSSSVLPALTHVELELQELGTGCRLAAAAKAQLLKCQLVWSVTAGTVSLPRALCFRRAARGHPNLQQLAHCMASITHPNCAPT